MCTQACSCSVCLRMCACAGHKILSAPSIILFDFEKLSWCSKTNKNKIIICIPIFMCSGPTALYWPIYKISFIYTPSAIYKCIDSPISFCLYLICLHSSLSLSLFPFISFIYLCILYTFEPAHSNKMCECLGDCIGMCSLKCHNIRKEQIQQTFWPSWRGGRDVEGVKRWIDGLVIWQSFIEGNNTFRSIANEINHNFQIGKIIIHVKYK